jgi:hypothetical protein
MIAHTVVAGTRAVKTRLIIMYLSERVRYYIEQHMVLNSRVYYYALHANGNLTYNRNETRELTRQIASPQCPGLAYTFILPSAMSYTIILQYNTPSNHMELTGQIALQPRAAW